MSTVCQHNKCTLIYISQGSVATYFRCGRIFSVLWKWPLKIAQYLAYVMTNSVVYFIGPAMQRALERICVIDRWWSSGAAVQWPSVPALSQLRWPSSASRWAHTLCCWCWRWGQCSAATFTHQSRHSTTRQKFSGQSNCVQVVSATSVSVAVM